MAGTGRVSFSEIRSIVCVWYDSMGGVISWVRSRNDNGYSNHDDAAN